MATWGHVLLVTGLVTVITPLLGRWLASVMACVPGSGDRLFAPLERVVFRVAGVDPEREQRWTVYAASVVSLGAVSIMALYGLLRLQAVLPLNPTGAPAVAPAPAFNIAVSFVTNTNWQNYAGEVTLGHLSQMLGVGVQNFVSAATGFAVLAALTRGIARRRADTVGNFWVDVTRFSVRVLLPASMMLAVLFVGEGMIQNLDGFTPATTLEGLTQQIPGGPLASQVAIKQLGTNGGGFLNANSAHPLENPSGITNIASTLAIIVIPFASVNAFGRVVGNRGNARVIMAVMASLWLASVVVTVVAEGATTPTFVDLGVDQAVTAESPGGNMEGKEARFGPAISSTWAASTTATSNGSVNSMHGSYTPVGTLVVLVNILLGEVSPGGVGVGLTGMLVHVMLAVFIAGLMVGRTPEYLGKKIQAAEMKLVTLYVLAMPVVVLGFAAASIHVPGGLDAMASEGPRGFTELLYAFASTGNNNGSAMAGFASNTAWYNVTQSIAMLAGRFLLIIPVLGIAGSLASKQASPPGVGTFPTNTPLFAGLLLGVIVTVAGLTFFPALALGPVAEALAW